MVYGEVELSDSPRRCKTLSKGNTVHKFELTFQKPNDILIKHKNYNRY